MLASTALVALLAFGTVSVALRDGVTVFVVIAFVMLAVLGFGVLGALTWSDDD